MKPLDRKTVLELRRLFASGERVGDLAEAFDLAERTVSNVVNGRTHTRVTEREHEVDVGFVGQQSRRRRMSPEEREADRQAAQSRKARFESESKAHAQFQRTGLWPSWWDPGRRDYRKAPTHVCFCGFEGDKEQVLEHQKDGHPLKVCPICRADGKDVYGDYDLVLLHIRTLHPDEKAADSDSETAFTNGSQQS